MSDMLYCFQLVQGWATGPRWVLECDERAGAGSLTLKSDYFRLLLKFNLCHLHTLLQLSFWFHHINNKGMVLSGCMKAITPVL